MAVLQSFTFLEPTQTLELVFLPVWVIVGGLTGLAFVDPELAFRYSNIFQLRDVELSTFGVVLHVGGAFFGLVAGFPYLILTNPVLGPISAVAIYGGAGATLYRYWPPDY